MLFRSMAGKWACDYSAVRGWEASETLCDGLDNDCDGETDEGLSGSECPGQPCVPDCTNVECGPDPVCRTDCGGCGDGYNCQSGHCIQNSCVPDCTTVECGPDPVCGTDCGGCDDGNVCTTDECNGLGCVHTPSLDACDDNNLCTVDDMCTSDFRCVGTPVTCSDNNPCTDDRCLDGQWIYTSNFGTCDDDDACTENDKCDASGNCDGAVVTCDDGDVCTTGQCDRVTGCSYVVSTTCDDSDVCTHDSCDPVVGCQYLMEPDVDCGTQECGLSANGCWWCGDCPADRNCGSDQTCGCPIGYQGENCDSCADGYTGYPDCFLPAVQIAAGNDFTCELTTAGGVKCWGGNEYGQLGNGTTVSSASPVGVTGMSSGVKSLTLGYRHACALMETGGVMCWGNNSSGQLGDGTTVAKLAPTQVTGLASGVAAFSAGSYHTCAVLESGAVKCWGQNSQGQLGDGSSANRTTPIQVSGLSSGVTAASAGGSHTCALLGIGGIKCWGDNQYGQVGDGTTDDRTTPTQASGLESGVISIAAGGSETCAIVSSGGLKCWGSNNYGQIGDATTDNKTLPTQVSGLESGVQTVAVGNSFVCAVLDSGVLKCWGYNYYGQVGDGTTDNRAVPTPVNGLDGVIVSVSSGGSHTCALLDSGRVMNWGLDSSGQLGIRYAAPNFSSRPVDVAGLQSGATAVSVGAEHVCALMDDGGVKCWGSNATGKLGDGTRHSRSVPVSVVGLDGTVASVSAGSTDTCALLNSGGVECWHSVPALVTGLESGVTSVSNGYDHACALLESGGVKCWGTNSFGQLGDGTKTASSVPIDVSGLDSGVSSISAGRLHTCALMDDETVRCWGHNGSGQLGDGSVVNSPVPVVVQGLGEGAVSISAGFHVTCSLLVDGAVKCWGAGAGGSTPSPVNLLDEPVTTIVDGDSFKCFLTEVGAVKCWGTNSHGQLGDGTETEKKRPVGVMGLSSGVVALDCDSCCCAVTNEGAVKCWGKNDFGQLGDGLFWSTVPVAVGN